MKAKEKRTSLKNIQKKIFRTQLILIVTLALFLGFAGTLLNIHFETEKRDQNLQNVAEAIAKSPLLTEKEKGEHDTLILYEYLDSLRDTLDSIDVISVVSKDNVRLYHSTHELIGTIYDGTLPNFLENQNDYYATNENGPSGNQRRAYAAIYTEDGEYAGFVMAIVLMKNIREETMQILLIFALITAVAILIELLISAELSSSIKDSLLGYEPDVFSAMYQIRDNILESLDEGIIAADGNGKVQFINHAASVMLEEPENGFDIHDSRLENENILLDRIPIKENGKVVGTVGILHDRAEYTKLMEDLTGTRYLVDSMRANNHDFTNKLHVILGLIQMEMYEEAISYIQNITLVQRETISKIMKAVDEPAVAALLIGKTARAAELNVKFVLREGSLYSRIDYPLPTEVLVTVIGNLIENAFEAMNAASLETPKELVFGIYSRQNAVLITTDDTGIGIPKQNMDKIFENGFSTKGDGRGTGLYQVKTTVERLGGTITVESQEGIGTSFAVSFIKKGSERDV